MVISADIFAVLLRYFDISIGILIIIIIILFESMFSLDYEERPQPGGQLSFMLHELVFSGYH